MTPTATAAIAGIAATLGWPLAAHTAPLPVRELADWQPLAPNSELGATVRYAPELPQLTVTAIAYDPASLRRKRQDPHIALATLLQSHRPWAIPRAYRDRYPRLGVPWSNVAVGSIRQYAYNCRTREVAPAPFFLLVYRGERVERDRQSNPLPIAWEWRPARQLHQQRVLGQVCNHLVPRQAAGR